MMKKLNNIDKKDIDLIVCTRYIEGYSDYDNQYKSLISTLVQQCTIKKSLINFDNIPTLVGEFNAITKKIYEDMIIQLYKIKYKKYPLMEEIYSIIYKLPT